MLAEYTCEELAAGLDRVVEGILAEVGISEPPVDALTVAQALGIAVAWDHRQEGRARYVRLSPRRAGLARPTILLKPEPRAERRQWAVAHEIGEHVACHVFAEWGIDPVEAGPNAREKAANNLAGRLLLPSAWFEADGASMHWDLFALKARFATASHELIARRMLECRPQVIITIFDQKRITFRRGNMPGRTPSLTKAELGCWHDVQQCGYSVQRQEETAVVQGWAIYEEGWKREILRMEVDESAMAWLEGGDAL